MFIRCFGLPAVRLRLFVLGAWCTMHHVWLSFCCVRAFLPRLQPSIVCSDEHLASGCPAATVAEEGETWTAAAARVESCLPWTGRQR
ncbi:hypothetical protein BS78_06G258800 [Paspalum vaginatum]|nr:hypothetical protein BS78_06G258800 [Paspalum vaginatum]